jgi:hypothetical protein
LPDPGMQDPDSTLFIKTIQPRNLQEYSNDYKQIHKKYFDIWLSIFNIVKNNDMVEPAMLIETIQNYIITTYSLDDFIFLKKLIDIYLYNFIPCDNNEIFNHLINTTTDAIRSNTKRKTEQYAEKSERYDTLPRHIKTARRNNNTQGKTSYFSSYRPELSVESGGKKYTRRKKKNKKTKTIKKKQKRKNTLKKKYKKKHKYTRKI